MSDAKRGRGSDESRQVVQRRRAAEAATSGGPRKESTVRDLSLSVDASAVQRRSFESALVQLREAVTDARGPDPSDVQSIAASGLRGSGGTLPHLDRIGAAFGQHDVSHVQAHVGGAAAQAASAIGASAYASGDQVAFAEQPTLHTAAHEAAHVVQQRAGVPLEGGVGAAGDVYEQHADAVADAVVRGDSAAPLLDGFVGAGKAGGVQRKAVQRVETPTTQQLANRVLAETNIGQLERDIRTNFLKWRVAARNVGSGYELAGQRHKTACDDAAKEKALHEAIMFGILTAVTAGALSWVSSAAQAGKGLSATKELFFNVLEDTVQSGVGEGIDVAQTKVAPPSKPVGQNPLGFQNDLLNVLDELAINVNEYFKKVVGKIKAAPWSCWTNFDGTAQVAKHTAWLASSKLSKAPTVAGKSTISNSLETDMWAKWAPGLIRWVKSTSPRSPTGRRQEITDPGSPVEKRLNTLGITKAAGIGSDFGWWTTDGEVRKLVSWGKSHKPKKLLDL